LRFLIKKWLKLKKYQILLAVFLLISVVLFITNVSDRVTAEDKIYISKILSEFHVPPYTGGPHFDQQIQFIHAVQKAVLQLSPRSAGIPYFHSREPKDLYESRSGLCYDRSRVIEKILRLNGFEVLHLSIYTRRPSKYRLIDLLSFPNNSHAISEVKTEKGWVVVDSNAPWISVAQDHHPVSIKTIEKEVNIHPILWEPQYQHALSPILQEPFIYVIGLYSRTGKLYPPFPAPLPNVNWKELLYNVVQ